MMYKQVSVRVAGVVLAALMLVACNNSDSSSSQDKTKPLSRARAVQLSPQATMLKTGQPPMNLMFGQGGHIRIVDATTAKTLVDKTVDPNTIISIDTKAGILLNRDTAKPGPLAADHRYEIWWDPTK